MVDVEFSLGLGTASCVVVCHKICDDLEKYWKGHACAGVGIPVRSVAAQVLHRVSLSSRESKALYQICVEGMHLKHLARLRQDRVPW